MVLGSCQVEKIEVGEDHQEALKRELIEEQALQLRLEPIMGKLMNISTSHRDTYYHNPAYLYEATSFKKKYKNFGRFLDHIAWFPIDEAIEKLKRGSHKWGMKLEKSSIELTKIRFYPKSAIIEVRKSEELLWSLSIRQTHTRNLLKAN